MNRWTALDWTVTVAPFVILAAIAYAARRRARNAVRQPRHT